MNKPLEKVAAFIVDRRKGFYLIYILLAIFSVFSTGWVKVDNDLTDYLDEASETRRGLTMMDEEFTTYATAEVMVDNIAYDDAETIRAELEKIEGVKEIAFDSTDAHYSDAAALFSVTFDGEADDPVCETALAEIENRLKNYDLYVSAELGDTKADTTQKEMTMVMIIACVIILSVLTLTSRTYMEIPVLVLTFGISALLNKGTNFMFGTISFISNSISVVLQLALAIDYAIILCHRYTEEREKLDPRDSVVQALCKAIPEISGSCLTTLSGLGAMSFMHFRLGFDMSMVMIKAIIISIITVFTLMPGLLLSFSPLIDKTHHRSFVPQITAWNNLVVKLRYVAPAIFAVLVVSGFFLSKACPYVYSYTGLSTITKNEAQIAQEMIDSTFSSTNVLAVLIPSGDYEKEQALANELEAFDQVDSVTALAAVEAKDGYSVGDRLSPREFSELTDIDVELVRLVYTAYASKENSYGRIVGGIDDYRIALVDLFDFVYEMTEEGYVSLDEDTADTLAELNEKLSDGKLQLESDDHSRLVLNLNLPEESPETFEFLDTVRSTAEKYYDDVTLAGNSTNDFDLSSTFGHDNTLISILSILFVMLVLFFTFQSAGIPIILILVIQGSVWINFSFPTMMNKPLFFMSYLIVSSIQMGANIDYAIVITNRYTELRHEMSKLEAIKQSLNLAFPTIFTSGSILAAAGAAIGLLSSEPAISSIGVCPSRGTLISIILVMGVLPQLLVLGDFIIDKTSFSIKNIRRAGAGAMAAVMTAGLVPAARAESEVVTISNREELAAFAKACTLDTWSKGKTVVLTADIDMENVTFLPIPTFGGSFDGGGHTISNLSITGSGSDLGFFRHIQEGAEVYDLNVSGKITPGGSRNRIGGVAGDNAGTIRSCAFIGAVDGENRVGGVAGTNTGQILKCKVKGSVEGQNSTGGIAGENSGYISGCENRSAVNTSPEEKKRSLSALDADAGSVVENLLTLREENEEESVLGHTDTGGVAGRNTGIIQGCKNIGDVGYQHVGYNVGGVAGRQSGYMLGCENAGLIRGRKDVGGIVGQAEPYITLTANKTALDQVKNELTRLNSMISGFISDTNDLTDEAGGHLDEIRRQTGDALDSAEVMADSAGSFVDDNVAEINAMSASLSDAVGRLADASDGLTNGARHIDSAMDRFAAALDAVNLNVPDLSGELDEVKKADLSDAKEALDEIRRAETDLSAARSRARSALNALQDGISAKNEAEERAALTALSAAIKDAAATREAMTASLEVIETLIRTRPESFGDLVADGEEISSQLRNVIDGLKSSAADLKTVESCIDELILNTELNFNSFRKAANRARDAIDDLDSGLSQIRKGLSDLGKSIDSGEADELRGSAESAAQKIDDFNDEAETQLKTAKGLLSDGFKSLSYAAEDVDAAVGSASDIISDFAAETNPEFVTLGEDFKAAGDSLLDSFGRISEELSGLSSSVSGSGELSALGRINDQLSLVAELTAGELDGLQNSRDTERFVDASDEDIENTRQGKVTGCTNSGSVEGDRNVGGIAGALAVEYVMDPEDEIEKPDALNFTYTSKAVLTSCVNEGPVTGKKDCVGGVVGLGGIGTVYKCENYALADSTSGGYVGGVAGRADDNLRYCYSKSDVSGGKYVGGIAGKGESLSGCISLSQVSGEECVGAVLGGCEDMGGVSGNYFIDRGRGGVDGISYSGRAEPAEYQAIVNMPGVPARLVSFTVTFIADGKTVSVQEVKYGSDTGRILYPEIPKKEGCFGRWPKIEESSVNADIELVCQYEPYITVISSPEKEGELSIVLAEGSFTDEAEIHAVKTGDGTYDIELTGTELTAEDSVALRLLAAAGGKSGRAAVQIKTPSGWRKVSSKIRGQYIVFDAAGTSASVRIIHERSGILLPMLILAVLMLAAAVIIVLRKIKKRS